MATKRGWETLLESQGTFPGPTKPTTFKTGGVWVDWIIGGQRQAQSPMGVNQSR